VQVQNHYPVYRTNAFWTSTHRLNRFPRNLRLLKPAKSNHPSKLNELSVPLSEINIDKKKPRKLQDALSGLSVALAVFPSAMAFANIAGVNPILGIWSSFFVGLISSLYGGRSGMIAGAASAVAVPLAPVVKALGAEYLQATIATSSAMMALFSLMKLGSLISHVTDPAIFGFLNGLGFVIMKSQLHLFVHLRGLALSTSILVALGTVVGIHIIPRITKTIPSSLLSVIFATFICSAFKLPVQTLADIGGAELFSGGLSSLPKFSKLIPQVPFTFTTLRTIVPTALSVSLIASLQSLLCCDAVVRSPKICMISETDNDRVLMGVALGNFISGLFGGIGGCGLILFTKLNMINGGRGAISSLATSLALGIFTVLAAPLVAKIPIASLAGIMFVVSFNSVQWKNSFVAAKLAFSKQGSVSEKLEFVALFVASLLCAFVNMAAGIIAGVLITKLGKLFIFREKENAKEV